MNRQDIINLIHNDQWMIEVLKITKKLNLPDWWIGAGFVRSKVWDTLHEYQTRTPLPDIDVIYFDKTDFSQEETKKSTTQAEIAYEKILKKLKPEINWSVTNQARMHLFHKHKPYKNSTEALAQWVETATCIGVSLDEKDTLLITAPRGIKDLVELKLRPTPDNRKNPKTFYERIDKKQWLSKWPKLVIEKNS